MRYYLAPMEGITGHIYRNALEKYFPGTDRYFTPFIAPDQNRVLRTKELRDVLPENNRVGEVIPQILTNNPAHFGAAAQALQELGYQEVNLNLGCPSGTVVSKKRGSGFLAYPEELDRFLEQIFDENQNIRISVKTRIGRDDEEEAWGLMDIYRKYPLSELIIHPRTQKDFYRGQPRMEIFSQILSGFPPRRHAADQLPICYNGNLLTEQDYRQFTQQFLEVNAVMLGRGVISNPGLIMTLKTGKRTDRQTLRDFHDEILEGYRQIFGNDGNALHRMKEMWIYLAHLFASPEKYMKKIRKARSLAEYSCVVDALFREQELRPDGPAFWNLPQR